MLAIIFYGYNKFVLAMNQLKIEVGKTEYYPGARLTGKINLATENPLETQLIKLQVSGLEKTRVQAIKGQLSQDYSDYNYILKNEVPLIESSGMEEANLEPGEYEFIFEFRIPTFALPSYSGKNVDIIYKLNANVDEPNWSNITDELNFVILRNKKALNILKEPVHFHSDNYFKPDDGRPSFYLQLSKGGYLQRETIEGNITLKNIDGSKIKSVYVRLLGKEFASAKGFHKTVLLHKSKKEIPGDSIIKGIPIQFKFPIPENIPSSYEGLYSNFRWLMEVDLDWEFEYDIKASHPIEIIG
jgi:hypothetical protein